MISKSEAATVLAYWFGKTREYPETIAVQEVLWWGGSPSETKQIDSEIRTKFGGLVSEVSKTRAAGWVGGARQRLALVVVFDQFRRNIHRGTSAAFELDYVALDLVQTGIESRQDQELTPLELAFFYMPLQHAESLSAQEESVKRFQYLSAKADARLQPYLSDFAKYAVEHREIIRRFGRFPHRNAILRRESTADEIHYLNSGTPNYGQVMNVGESGAEEHA